MIDEEKLKQEAELQRKIEKAKIENMRMREEIAAIREEHNYWRALYHTTAIDIFTQLAGNYRCEFDARQAPEAAQILKRIAEAARTYAKELIGQLKEEDKLSQRL